MSRKRVIVITAGIMLALFMAAVESTVVATAMPTIIGQLGGLSIYSWVFSAYMLTSTTTVPIYGKLSDLYGRRTIFLISMGLFLAGSVLSGRSSDMTQLIAFRALQGLGAGGLLPLAFIIIGDLFNFEQRARMQGLFSGVWGVASIVGPLLGGFLVDQVSWHWVFYVNVAPGILAALLVGFAWQEGEHLHAGSRLPIDYAGAGILSLAVVLLLLGLFDMGNLAGWGLIALSIVLFGLLLRVESRAPDPVLPISLFRNRLFTIACVHGLFAGWSMFGSSSYVPLFAQGVLGTSATVAGSVLTPQMLSWTLASVVGSRLMLRWGYRTVSLAGMAVLVLGAFFMARIDVDTSLVSLMVYFALMGVGMGVSLPAFLIAVQSAVARPVLGTATAAVQFSRSIGGTLGVSVMGIVLSTRLAAGLVAGGIDPSTVSLEGLTNPVASAAAAPIEGALKLALAGGVRDVFVVALVAAVLGLAATFLTPGERSMANQAPSPAESRDLQPASRSADEEGRMGVAGGSE